MLRIDLGTCGILQKRRYCRSKSLVTRSLVRSINVLFMRSTSSNKNTKSGYNLTSLAFPMGGI